MPLKIKINGFEKMLEHIQEAGKDVDTAAAQAIKDSASIVETELRASCITSGVPDSITREIRKKVTASNGTYSAEVGWELGAYNPKDPSTGYKAIFLNYGTVRRQTARGKNRGAIRKKPPTEQFIARAKKAAKPKIRKAQQRIIDTVKGDIGK